jgi:hypothetical protein
MPLRDEQTFSEEEWIAAFSILMTPERAREEGRAWSALPDPKGFEDAMAGELEIAGVNGPRSYDGDLLDLLSLVSDSCAERAWHLLGISREEGERRRTAFQAKVDHALRLRDEEQA